MGRSRRRVVAAAIAVLIAALLPGQVGAEKRRATGRPATAPGPGAPGADPTTCTRCGHAPMYPTRLCADGRHQGGRGPCVQRQDGTCGWLRLVCPEDRAPAGAGECTEAECGSPPVGSRWSCPGGGTGAFGGCKRDRGGSCGWVEQPCLDEAPVAPRPRPTKPPAPPTPPPPPPAPARPPAPTPEVSPPPSCSPLPSVAELRKWPVSEVCEPGGGPAPPPLVMLRALGDETFIFALRDRCFRARYKRCFSK